MISFQSPAFSAASGDLLCPRQVCGILACSRPGMRCGGALATMMKRTVGNSWLGTAAQAPTGLAAEPAIAIPEPGAVEEEEEEEGDTPMVLVVVDANKEVSTHALDWALSYVVQKGDAVKLLGVLHHILNPMGYKSRADEKSWNGANRKVLDTEIAAHKLMFESIPNVYERVAKLGAKLEIEVRAHVHCKTLVVEEAKRLNARYVVIDRHIKKDKKFYIDNLKCFVTRVKTVTNFEHLRHGVPETGLEEIPPAATPTPAPTLPPSRPESASIASPQPRLFPQHRSPYDVDSITPASSLPSGYYHGMANAYNMESMREMELRRWFSDPSHIVHSGVHPGESVMLHPPSPPYSSAFQNYQAMRSALPPLQPGRANTNRHSLPSARPENPATPGFSSTLESSAFLELQAIRSEGPKSSRDGPRPGPISVQPRRAADASWALDLLGVGNPEVQALAMPNEDARAPAPTRSSSVRRAVSSKKQSPGAPPLCSVCGQQSPDFGKVKRFSFRELQDATGNFSTLHSLADGGYGSVFKGVLKEGQLVVIKQHKLGTTLTNEQFAAEVEALACAQHRNLVTLIGYCIDKKLRLLVYEFICNGSLDRHLSAKSRTDLPLKIRLKIALGTARALRYLHEECRVGCIIHRDMRPNNILLTHDFTPMVGDFGLARRQTSGDEAEETRVLGTIGYLAPEYAETGKITDGADVYAFGIVLLELITGRKAIDNTLPRDQVFLTEWARPLLDSYDRQLVDRRLKAIGYDEYEMHCMMHAANMCIKRDPSMRPRMVQVLRILNPPESSDWTPGRGKGVVMPLTSDGDLSSSKGGSCSHSDASNYSSDASDTGAVPRQQRPPSKSSLTKFGTKSLWKSFTREKLLLREDSTRLSIDSTRDIAAVNRMSVDDNNMSYNAMF